MNRNRSLAVHARRFVLILATVLFGASSVVLAKAPTSKDVMRPVDTTAGSFTDTKHMFQVDLDRQVSVSSSGQPLEVAFNQISSILGIEWGYVQGVDRNAPVTLNLSGSAREVLKALGKAANIRYEAGGPTQVRVLQARSAAPRKPAVPPPHKRP